MDLLRGNSNIIGRVIIWVKVTRTETKQVLSLFMMRNITNQVRAWFKCFFVYPSFYVDSTGALQEVEGVHWAPLRRIWVISSMWPIDLIWNASNASGSLYCPFYQPFDGQRYWYIPQHSFTWDVGRDCLCHSRLYLHTSTMCCIMQIFLLVSVKQWPLNPFILSHLQSDRSDHWLHKVIPQNHHKCLIS